MPELRIEPMRPADLDEVLEIERSSFPTPWSREAFRHELERNRVADCWVAREAAPGGAPGPVVGYACLWVVADEVHVTNLAVAPAHRGRGIGGWLLGTLLVHHRARGAVRAFLEVRPGNLEARRLYARLGFREVGRRRGYYIDTGEDALLLEARLGEALPAGSPPGRPRNPGAG